MAAVSLTIAANLLVNRLPPPAYVPANLSAAGAMTWFARRLGATWSDMGMDPRRLGRGARWGLAAIIPIAAAIGLGAAIPATRRLFVDDQAAGDPRRALYRTLVHIPLGTALAEEILFRGALLGILERRRSRPVADTLSGVLFGLSHILPTIDRLGNGTHSATVGHQRHARAGAVLGVVLATMAAGYGLAWLRDRSGSLAAPVIAHAALNDLAFLAARAASRRDSR
jgi:membrane protease YdiL (CAAX protease family)